MHCLFQMGGNKEDIILLAAILKRIGFKRGASFLRGSIKIAEPYKCLKPIFTMA